MDIFKTACVIFGKYFDLSIENLDLIKAPSDYLLYQTVTSEYFKLIGDILGNILSVKL